METRRWIRVMYHRKWRDREFVIRAALVIGFVALMTLIMPRSIRFQYQHEVGKIWKAEALKAPFDFAVYKTPDSLAADQSRAAAAVLPICVYDSQQVAVGRERLLTEWNQFQRRLEEYHSLEEDGDDAALGNLAQTYFQRELGGIIPRQFPENQSWQRQLEARLPALAEAVYAKGYLQEVPDTQYQFLLVVTNRGTEWELPISSLLVGEESLAAFLRQNTNDLPEAQSQLLARLGQRALGPNLRYDPQLTVERREERMSWVSPLAGFVQEGETVVEKNQSITPEISRRLESLMKEQARISGQDRRAGVVAGQFVLIFLLTLLMFTFLRVNRPQIFFSNQKLALLLTTILLVVAAMVVATKLSDVAVRLTDLFGPNINLSYIYLAPACIVPIFMNNFFDHRVAFFSNLVVAFFGAVLIQQGMEYAFVQLIAGAVTVYSLRRLRKREVFFYTLGFIFLGYTVAYVTFNLYSKGNLDVINFHTLLLFGINVVLTVIAYNLIYLFEQVFRVTSDLTYLELLDTNHPLLKDLAKKAPGTFQHSLQVANIAEAVVSEIGGNALLIHVGALYHDIGKMAYPRFFIENQQHEGFKGSPHDTLDCQESADIIVGHVAKGVALAHKYHLPRELIHFIETHHGTTRVEYFYRKHLKEKQCRAPEDEELFRYPGPLPFSKETAVLMLADSVEAAARSVKQPTVESLEKLIDQIIDHKINDQQMVNSPLTFRDISTIREVLKKQLLTIYHGRIEYPKPQEELATASN